MSRRREEAIRKKLVLVGDGFCGKTSLHSSLRRGDFTEDGGNIDSKRSNSRNGSCSSGGSSSGSFNETYCATIFENFVTSIEVKEGFEIELSVWDTAGQEDYERLRPLSYPDTHVILLCFAIDSPDSLQNVEDKWIKELRYFCPGVPIILVGKQPQQQRFCAILNRGKNVQGKFNGPSDIPSFFFVLCGLNNAI